MIFIGMIVGLIILVGLVFWLASKNIFFTFVKEGTAKNVMKAGEFNRTLMRWRGYGLDNDWNVVNQSKGRFVWGRIFGGLYFYGLSPFYKIDTYYFQWTGVKENGELQPHPKEKLDYIILKDDVYWAKIENAEDSKLLNLTVEIFFTIRVVNPHKARFNVQNWLETVINRSKPAVRDAITTADYENLIKKTDAIGTIVYQRIRERGLFAEFKERYGIEIRKIETRKIDPPPEYRGITLREYIATQEKKKITIEAEAQAIRLASIAKGAGKALEEASPEERKKAVEKAYSRQQSIDGDAFLKIEAGGGNLDNGLAKLIGLLKFPWPPQKRQQKTAKKVRVPGGTRELSEEERKRLKIP